MENTYFARVCLIAAFLIGLLTFVDFKISYFELQWHYYLVRPFIIISFFLLSYQAKKTKNIPLYYYDIFSFLLYSLAFYGIVYIAPAYTFCFMHVFIAIAITTQTTTYRFVFQSLIGLILCLVGHYLTPEPRIIVAGKTAKPIIFLATFIFQLISGIIYVFVTRYRLEINSLNEKYALIGQKSSFLIHEIKSPLSRVYGQTQLSGEHQEILININNETKRILSIIESVETLIYNPNGLEKTFHQFSLKEIKDETQKEYSQYLDSMNIDFRFDNEETIIFGNKNLIYQLFKNLIENAIEAIGYQKDQRPLIHISSKSFNNKTQIIIRNTHSFIPKNMRKRTFDPHFTTKPTMNNKGLGLSLVNSIVKAHKADIEVNSDLYYTEFIITLNNSFKHVQA